MDRPDPHAVVGFLLALFGASLISLSASFCDANDAVTPPRNISVVEKSPEVPQWKTIWDNARNLVKEEDFQGAVREYERFFQLKENIEEAQWEYAKVLFQVGQLKKAEKLLANLLEKKPYRTDYLLLSGKIAFDLGDYTLSAKRFGLALEQDPNGKDSDEALEGLANSMRKLGRANVSLALNQQLLVRHPQRMQLYYLIGKDAADLHDFRLALQNYETFIQKQGLGTTRTSVLYELLDIYQRLGVADKQPGILQELISRGDRTETNKNRLVRLYLASDQYERAIAQLSNLYDETGKSRYLQMAGDISRQKLDRPDKALAFYEKIAIAAGDDQDVKKTIAEIQQKLAKDFLAIVENGGASLLWDDLLSITQNRLPIFLDIAGLLQKRKKRNELIEVYSILHDEYPENTDISFELADNLFTEKRYPEVLKTLNSIGDAQKRDKEFYLFKSRIETLLGMERESLESARKALMFTPDDAELLTTCLETAGRFGLVREMEEIFQNHLKAESTPEKTIVLTYLKLLSVNSLFSQFEKVMGNAQEWFVSDSEVLDQLDLLHSVVLLRQDKNRAAEQLLREMVGSGRGREWPAVLLAEMSLAKGDTETAQIWYDMVVEKSSEYSATGEHPSSVDLQARMALIRQKLRQAEGDESYSSSELRSLFFYNKFTPDAVSRYSSETRAKLLTEFCLNPSVAENTRLRSGCIAFMQAVQDFDPVIYRISAHTFPKSLKGNIVYPEIEKDYAAKWLYTNNKPVTANVLDLVESDIRLGWIDKAREHLDAVGSRVKDSTRAMVLASQIELQKGELDAGIKTLQELNRDFPQEEFFFAKLVEAKMRKGLYSQGLKDIYGRFQASENPIQLAATLLKDGLNEEVLLLARILWGEKEHKDALKIYKMLLSPSVREVMSAQFKEKKINYLDYSRDRSFWNSMLVLMQAQPDILEELMKPEFLTDNAGNDTGRIVAANFKLYSWQKFIYSEYMAKKAIYDKNYYFAEQSYKKLVDNENAEGLKDLAEIYSRLGKHRKEAQVYETIQSRGEETPEILTSMERTSLQLSPQNGGELVYSKREGRDNQVDMAVSSFATAFSFTPDLNIDAEVRYTNNNYESVKADETAGSNSVYGSTNFELFKGYEIDLGAGSEKLNGTSGFSMLYRLGLQGQFDEFFNGYVILDRQPVTDTISAVRQQITKQNVKTGLNCETPVGVAFGMSILHSDYTGDNNANQFNAYSSYSIFGEKVLLSFRYDYEYLAGDTEDFIEGENYYAEDSPAALYWLPDSYSEHSLTMSFKQDFLGYRVGDKEGMSYYKVNGGIGYEDSENVIYSGGVEFFLEMNPHFLLKGNFNFSQSPDYKERGLFMSLFYRW